jgi:hypothetical protein
MLRIFFVFPSTLVTDGLDNGKKENARHLIQDWRELQIVGSLDIYEVQSISK